MKYDIMYYMYRFIYTAHTVHIKSARVLVTMFVCFSSILKRNFKQVVVISDIRLMLCVYHSWENCDLFILGLGLVNYRTNIDGCMSWAHELFGQFELFSIYISILALLLTFDFQNLSISVMCASVSLHRKCVAVSLGDHFPIEWKVLFSFKLMSEHLW